VYDAENHLVQAKRQNGAVETEIATYHYDAEGRRVKAIVGGVTTIYVYDLTGKLIAEYGVPAANPAGLSYVTLDTLGSVRLTTTSDGQVRERHDYLPYGEEIPAAYNNRANVTGYGVDTLRQKFSAKERDIETGLDYFNARYYASMQSRFTSPDPTLLSVNTFNPQTWNRYAYVLNNPLAYIDPLGLWALRIEVVYKKNKKGEDELDSQGRKKVDHVVVTAIKTRGDADNGATLAKQLGLTGEAAENFAQKVGDDNNVRLSQQGGNVGNLFGTVERGLKDQEKYLIEHPNLPERGPAGSDCSETACRIAFPGQQPPGGDYNVESADEMIKAFGNTTPVAESDLTMGDIVRWADARNKPTHFATFIFRADDDKPVVFSKSGGRGPYEVETTQYITDKYPTYGSIKGTQSSHTGYYHPR
jgi:RHS repeat-associated protein